MREKLYLLFVLICFSSLNLNGQLHVGIYFSPAISVGGPVVKNLDLEGKLFLTDQVTNTNVQGALLYDFKKGRSFQISGGAGITVEVDDKAFFVRPIIPIEFEFIPIRSFRQLAFPVEIYLELDPRREQLNLALLIGIRYYFKEPKY